MITKKYQEYHYKASQLYRELAHQEHLAGIYLEGLRMETMQEYWQRKLDICREKMEQIKTEISELKEPKEATIDILGEAIFEPEDIEQNEFILFKNLKVGDSFYSEDLTRKYIKLSDDSESINARNVIDGFELYFPPQTLTYQRIKIDVNEKFMEELRGDFTADELKNYQPK